jgi:outer membrane protein TolC
MRTKIFFGIWLLASLHTCHGVLAQTLDWATFQQQVLEYHPVARQSNLQFDQAQAAQLHARGGFDPKSFANYSNKNFNGTNYFQFAEAGIKLPTWAGLELKATYNYANGNFLNPENKIPKNGQANFGLEWSLIQGLLIDERRANLKLARVGLDIGAAQRRAMRNDLLLESAKNFWNWVLAQESLKVTAAVLAQARVRHQGLVESFQQGDKPAIDTLESFIQVQSRQLDLQFARTEAQNTAFALAAFYWTNDNLPQTADNLPPAPEFALADLRPETAVDLSALVQQAQASHPELQLYQLKLRQLATERRLKLEKRKPALNVSYYLLGNGWEFFPGSTGQGAGVLANDIKWGLDFSYPLLNRKARGDYQLTQIKVLQTELELQQKIQDISAKVRQYGNDVLNLRAQVQLFGEISTNYRRLFEGEQEKFQQGESSIFLINTREQRWLDAQLKLLKLQAELKTAEAGLLWATGSLAPF